MLKLIKIYIENFKGIGTPNIVDLDGCSLSILSGPNGFGKTTIFDAVELCLSGKLQRTDSFSNVTKDSSDYIKPFYQHSKGRDVVLKLLLQNDADESYHIIAKFLDKDHEGRQGAGRRFKPNAWNILSTYYATVGETDTFGNVFVTDDYSLVDQAFIDNLFFSGIQLSHVNLYPLFNYLQQEENIYFLKKDEEQKKSELDFLFQSQQQSQELDNINQTHRKIREVSEELRQNIERLGSIASELSSTPYLPLFPDKSLPYDQEEIFARKSTDDILSSFNVYLREVDTLAEFINAFSVEEYRKEKAVEAMGAVLKQRSLTSSLVLFLLIDPERYKTYEDLNKKIASAKKIINDAEADIVAESELIEFGFTDLFISGYKEAIQQKARLMSTMGELDKIIIDLNEARGKVVFHSGKLPDDVHHHLNCPLCDTKWRASEELIKAVALKTDALVSHNSKNLELLDAANMAIEQNFKMPARGRAAQFLEMPENELEIAFFNSLTQYKGYRDIISRFISLLAVLGIDFGGHMLSSPVSYSVLQEKVDGFEASLRQKISEISPDQSRLLHKHIYKDLFNEDSSKLLSIDEVNRKREYIKSKYDQARHFSLQILTARLEKFQELERNIGIVKEAYSKAIKDFKRDMIERIKIPFYLYSGKILQNYQQGFGIFIEMQPNTARVRFLTDSNSDHDIVHHLSSGQLAVVSIAFCLSLNKVYKTSQYFKFLAVDDPVQTLDDINVHALIELMRHEFSDYQILLSTHETDIERYLHYKFGNFGFRCKRINVQREFFGVTEAN